VNHPEQAAKTTELLTRDADCPEEASGEAIEPPPQSKLVSQTMGAANGLSKVTSGVAGLKVAAARAGGVRGVAAPAGAKALA